MILINNILVLLNNQLNILVIMLNYIFITSDKSTSKYFSALDLITLLSILDSKAFGCKALKDSTNDIVSASITVDAATLAAVNVS